MILRAHLTGQPSITTHSPADFAARIIDGLQLPMPVIHENAPNPSCANRIAAWNERIPTFDAPEQQKIRQSGTGRVSLS